MTTTVVHKINCNWSWSVTRIQKGNCICHILIIANTSSSQNKISIFLVLLNTFNVKKKKKKHQQGFYSQEVTRSDSVFLREVNNKRPVPKVFADAHGSSQSLLKRAFRYSAQVTVKPKFYSAELIAYESESKESVQCT